jgi:hypothetical protein
LVLTCLPPPPPAPAAVEFEILAVIAFNLIAAFLPARGKFVPDEEELAPRPKGPLQDPRITLLEPKKFFGVTNFGFTKANELFVGRLAQLGFAAGELRARGKSCMLRRGDRLHMWERSHGFQGLMLSCNRCLTIVACASRLQV